MHVPGLRGPSEKVGGIVYFGRMLDKIRLHAAGQLPAGYNLGTEDWYFYDARCARFLGVDYAALRERALLDKSDEDVLRWCFQAGRKPNEEEIEIWNTFMAKRGWRDEASGGLEEVKQECGLAERKDITTWFDLFEVDESKDAISR
jgi:gluconokinase